MDLKTYIETQGLNLQQFATICQVSRPVVYKILRGEEVTLMCMCKIEKFTRGDVRVIDIIKDTQIYKQVCVKPKKVDAKQAKV